MKFKTEFFKNYSLIFLLISSTTIAKMVILKSESFFLDMVRIIWSPISITWNDTKTKSQFLIIYLKCVSCLIDHQVLLHSSWTDYLFNYLFSFSHCGALEDRRFYGCNA